MRVVTESSYKSAQHEPKQSLKSLSNVPIRPVSRDQVGQYMGCIGIKGSIMNTAKQNVRVNQSYPLIFIMDVPMLYIDILLHCYSTLYAPRFTPLKTCLCSNLCPSAGN